MAVAAQPFKPTKFINLQNRNYKVARIVETNAPYGGTMRKFIGTFIEFVDGEAFAATKDDYDTIKQAVPHAYEEPHDETLPLREDKLTHFVTRNQEAYDAWMSSPTRAQIVVGALPGSERIMTPLGERKGLANA